MESMGKQEWLNSFTRESTRTHNERSLRYFEEFSGLNPERMLEVRKAEGRRFNSRIATFWEWCQSSKKCSKSSASSVVFGLASFFRFHEAPLQLRRLIPDTRMAISSYNPTLEDLQKLYALNDLVTKVFMSLSRDCPARITDLLEKVIPQLPSQEFLIESEKEGIPGKVYISDKTLELYTQMKKARLDLPGSESGILKLLAKACEIASIPKLTCHFFRKRFLTVAINLNINETIIKVLSFKSVSKDMLTYFLNRTELREAWEKIVAQTPLEKSNGNGRVTNIEEMLDLVTRALVKLIRPEVERQMMNKTSMNPAKTMGLLEIPKLSAREILEEYLKS